MFRNTFRRYDRYMCLTFLGDRRQWRSQQTHRNLEMHVSCDLSPKVPSKMLSLKVLIARSFIASAPTATNLLRRHSEKAHYLSGSL